MILQILLMRLFEGFLYYLLITIRPSCKIIFQNYKLGRVGMRLVSLLLFIFINLYTTAYASTQKKLVFAIDVIRHGDRTPTADIPKEPHHWLEGAGQLTATGMQQEYQLGASLRKKYIEQYHLLPFNYSSNMIYVRSSDADRTLMSAQAFLMGLYPLGTGPYLPNSRQPALPNAFQPIPLHTVSKDQETLLVAWTESPQFKELLKTYIYPTPEWKAKSAELQPKFAAWSQATGIDITDLYQLKSLGDTLSIYQIYHVALPKDLSAEDAQQIIDAGHWVFVTAFKSSKLGRVTGYSLLKAVSDDLQQASQQKTSLKYKLFSAHDSNIFSLMSAMGTPLNEPPKYASDLNILLYEVGNQSYIVRVNFNGQAVVIPACGGNTCTLAQFSSLVDNNSKNSG